jgi:hypothetical protein
VTALPFGYERRYSTPKATVAHAAAVYRPDATARCGYRPHLAGWYGTGSQEEYEKAASLPLCKLCARNL